MDHDIRKMTRDELMNEIQKLRTGIRKHRDASGHDLCWYHPELWSLLPEGLVIPKVEVPNIFYFLWRCLKYRWSINCTRCNGITYVR